MDGIAHKVSVWNPSQDGMESVARQYGIKPIEIQPTADAMPDKVGIPFNSLGELMPYQAFGLD